MTYFRLAEKEDLLTIASLDLRDADKEEIRASVGLPTSEALMSSARVSNELWVVVHKGSIEAVFGVSDRGSYGVPWFMATDKFDEFRISFAKESRWMVQRWLDKYGLLMNVVDSRHISSIRWLRWLGFTVDESLEIMLHDPEVPFYLFISQKKEEPVQDV